MLVQDDGADSDQDQAACDLRAFAGDGAPIAFYVDGTSAPFSQENFCSSAPSVQAIDVAIGARWAGVPSTGFGLSGTIDEARIETEIRSPAWMSAQHRSMTNTLVTVGEVEGQ